MRVFRRKDIISLIRNGQIIFSAMPVLTRRSKTKSKTKIIIIVTLELFCPMPYTIKKGDRTIKFCGSENRVNIKIQKRRINYDILDLECSCT